MSLVCTKQQLSHSRPMLTTCSGARLGKECSREESKGGVVRNVPGSHFEFLPSPDTGYNEASSSTCICPQPVWGDRCYLFSLGQEGEEGKFLVLMSIPWWLSKQDCEGHVEQC